MTAAQQAIQTYRQQKAAAETAYRQNNRPTAYFRDHIAAAETLLQTLWQIHFPDSDDISLIAIGGFGRCELYPHSDWDLAIISSTPFSDGLKGGRYKKKGVAFGHTQTHTHQEERKII